MGVTAQWYVWLSFGGDGNIPELDSDDMHNILNVLSATELCIFKW